MKTHLAEDQIRLGWTGPCFEGPVYLEVDFHKDGSIVTVGKLEAEHYPPSALRGDIDNYLKLVMDGLNGAAYVDDSQIRLVVTRKL